MATLIRRTGNIFSTTASAVGHGCNTAGLMGAGIAKTFREMFPGMYEEYKVMCLRERLIGGGVFPWKVPGTERYVFNIASQEQPGRNASYDLLVQGVYTTLEWCEVLHLPVLALPRIGSGIGGLDEDIVEAILTKLAEKSPVDIELWTYKP